MIDFGLAESTDKKELLLPYCGCPFTAAPEVFSTNNEPQTPKFDIFSAGIVFYILLTNENLINKSA